MTAPPAIRAHDVCVHRGGPRVLSHVTFEVAQGEFVGLAGPNGGGKSTLVRALLGLLPISCGDIELFGRPLARFREFHRIGYVPQFVAHTDPTFPATAREIVGLGRVGLRGPVARLLGRPALDGRRDAEAVSEAMRAVGVERLAQRRIGELSGGERQRVFLAKALATRPDLLILDEPTTGVDPLARDDFAHLLMDLNRERGMTIVLVSHDTDILEHAASRVLVIDGGVRLDATTADKSSLAGLHREAHR